MDQFIIFYKNSRKSFEEFMNEETQHYYVKVKVFKGQEVEEKVEFEVVFGELPEFGRHSTELTINWHFDHGEHGESDYFYSDENAWRVVRRDLNPLKPLPEANNNFYPVTSVIAIDTERAQCMVFNDRI